MDTCDVLIVGGGPAGSSCARRLRHAGLDVVVMDRSVFPRDKVCAGWITPQVIDDLALDCQDYRQGRTFQPLRGFRTGVIGSSGAVETLYDRPVSFGIRRCEFDHYLLQRSGARLMLGTPTVSISRRGSQWIINDSITAPMLVGAGGHFCPVARWLNPVMEDAPLVVAQEAEFFLTPDEASAWPGAPDVPELYFCGDLSGYGWLFRKEQYVNIGLGRFDRHALPQATAHFVEFLRRRGAVPREATWRWRGHAYLVSDRPRRRATAAGVMLVGDAAGVAYPQSGEGIKPAIESGLLAAATIIGAKGRYEREQLHSYERHLHERFGGRRRRQRSSPAVLSSVGARLLPRVLSTRWFTRHVLLDKWFLRRREPPLCSPIESPAGSRM